MNSTPAISVIIPALNEAQFIGQCLQSLTQLRYPQGAWEVIVIDNESTDRTLEIVNSFVSSLPIRVFQKASLCVSGLRNFGARRATGERLIFLDADCVVPPEWLEQSVAAGRQTGAVLVGAEFRLPAGAAWVARAWWAHGQRRKEGPPSYLSAHNLHIGREAFLDLGGFDETLDTNEDYEFSQRILAAGGEISECPELSVIHLGNAETLRHFFRRERWHGRDVFRVFVRNLPKRHNFRAVAFAVYTLICLASLAAGCICAAAWHVWFWPVLAVFLLLVPPAVLACRGAAASGNWSLFPAQVVLFLTYGLARAVALLDRGRVSQRKLMKVATS